MKQGMLPQASSATNNHHCCACRVADTIRLAYNFPRMQQLSVRAEGCTWRMGQAVVVGGMQNSWFVHS